jgi:hypothetical protein
MTMRRALVLTILLLFTAALVPTVASARPLVGIGDQHASVYQDKGMRKLKLRTARYALAWDWYKDPYAIGQLDAWVKAVGAARMRPLIVFNRNWGPNGRRRIPPLREYVTSFKLFRARYPRIHEFSAWNEPNAPEQPFFKKPARAARYYNAMRRACRSCTIVGADINDRRTMLSYLRVYSRHIKGRVKVWGLHNYKDSTRARGTTRLFLNATRGPVWLTETGGLRDRGGLKAQAKSVRRVFAIARAAKRIKRIYFYQWKPNGNHWDSAFLGRNGKRRPAYYALRAGIKAAR